METTCDVCGLPGYDLPRFSVGPGKWQHRDSDACILAVGRQLETFRASLDECKSMLNVLIDSLSPEKRAEYEKILAGLRAEKQ